MHKLEEADRASGQAYGADLDADSTPGRAEEDFVCDRIPVNSAVVGNGANGHEAV
jgi:hypothetical protein